MSFPMKIFTHALTDCFASNKGSELNEVANSETHSHNKRYFLICRKFFGLVDAQKESILDNFTHKVINKTSDSLNFQTVLLSIIKM